MNPDYLEILQIALEAPTDVTKTAEDNTDDLVGDDAGTDEDDIDLGIPELEDDEEDTTDNTSDDSTNKDTDTEDTEDPDTSEDEDLPVEDGTAAEDYEKLKRIHQNTLMLSDMIEANRDSFVARFENIVKSEDKEVFHTIINGFDDLISITEAFLTNDFIEGSYTICIKKYVAINKVYDILVRMVSNFVDIYTDLKTKTKK